MSQTFGNTPANEIFVEHRAGSASLTMGNRLVTFSQPLPDTNYTILLEPNTLSLTITGKTPEGFTVSGITSVTIGWYVVQHV